jgi:hypothetical protein
MAASTSVPPPKILGTPQTAYAITPDDTAYLPIVPDWIWVGHTGDISVALPGNAGPVLFSAVPVGPLHIQPTRIFATLTTASMIVIVKNGSPPTSF